MLLSLLLGAFLSSSALAVSHQGRQADSGAEFSSAASQLISDYIPQSAFAVFEAKVQAVASSNSISYNDPQSLIYSALLATSVPGWFNSAIPSAYSMQLYSLEADISSLRAGVARAQATATGDTATVTVIIPVTTTDSNGSTFTTSVLTTTGLTTATGTAITGITTTGAITTTVPPITTTYTNSAGSTITSVIGIGVSGASSAGSVAVSGASSVVSVGIGGASSVISAASSVFAPGTTTSTAGAAMPTALCGVAAGVLGLVGLMAAM